MRAKNKTRGYYTFEDGYFVWVNGLSGLEKKNLIRQHGRIVSFEPSD